MTGWSWLLYLVLVAVAAAVSVWLYLRREPPGPGRLLLAGLRTLTLATLLLIVFDPALPAGRGGAGQRGAMVLLDASASMALPASAGDSATRWAAAVREARRRSGDVLLFGDRVRPPPDRSLPGAPPGDPRSLLLPALRAAAEAGADRVVVITDGALEGTGTLPAWLARFGLGVEWVPVGEPLGGLSLPEVTAPAWAAAGDPVELQVTIAATSPAPQSARLMVRQDGRTLADSVIAVPPGGSSTTRTVVVRPAAPPGGGYARLELVLEPGDALAADDRRFVSLDVSPDPAGVALVSLEADQEPRFLLPVLARALGVPATGFLRAGTGWVRVGAGPVAGEPVAEPELQRALGAAQLLVLQGAGSDAPGWLEPLLRAGPPLLLLGGSSPPGLPVRAGEPVSADWFLDADVPPSPVAELLADVANADLPPLPALAPAEAPADAWAPLLVKRGRSGEPRPLLLAGEAAGRRWAIALGEGYWRWAFQGGPGRALYDRLWSAVGGWLLAESGGDRAPVHPVSRVLAQGQPGRWVTPGVRADSMRLRLSDTGARVALDTVLRDPAGDTLQAPVLPPGLYRYRAQAFSGDRRLEGQGELTVETWSPELTRPLVRLADIAPADRLTRGGQERGTGRPLHTSAVPFALLVMLLSAEWVLRRRWGLR